MQTTVYAFKPKGKGYTVYATKTCRNRRGQGRRSSSFSSHGSGSTGLGFVSSMLAHFVVRGAFGKKK